VSKKREDLISVILPVYNEGRNLRSTIDSLLSQTGVMLEVLVIDGCSTDDSQAITNTIAAKDERVRLLINESRRTPVAFNIGIRESRGAYVAILGAHCEYARDYLLTCLEELRSKGAAGCSGRVVTRNADGSWGAAVSARVMSSAFAVSGSSFRTQPEGFADTVPYPVFRKDIFARLGGYNEELIRNQDNDMNFRIREAGLKLYCTHATSCVYYARPSLSGLMAYARNNGSWCGVSARMEPRSLGLRHYVPLLFVTALIAGLLLSIVGLAFSILTLLVSGVVILAGIPLHLFMGLVTTFRSLERDRLLFRLAIPVVILIFHIQYGAAFLKALLMPPTGLHSAQST
jgi:glycosyltransferase involved in cell wall biosynthesis